MLSNPYQPLHPDAFIRQIVGDEARALNRLCTHPVVEVLHYLAKAGRFHCRVAEQNVETGEVVGTQSHVILREKRAKFVDHCDARFSSRIGRYNCSKVPARKNASGFVGGKSNCQSLTAGASSLLRYVVVGSEMHEGQNSFRERIPNGDIGGRHFSKMAGDTYSAGCRILLLQVGQDTGCRNSEFLACVRSLGERVCDNSTHPAPVGGHTVTEDQ